MEELGNPVPAHLHSHPTPGEDSDGQTKDSADENVVGMVNSVPYTWPVLTAHEPLPYLQPQG